MAERFQAPRARAWTHRAVAAALLFGVLVMLGHAVTGARFYAPGPQDPVLAWVWRCTAALLSGAVLALGWTLSAASARTAGWTARVAGLALAGAPLTFVLGALAWSSEPAPVELVVTQVCFSASLACAAVGTAAAAASARRTEHVA
jgi:hypothetical protein